MWNLVKAQNYQLKRDNAIIYIYLAGLICIIVSLVEHISNTSFQELTGSNCGIMLGEMNFIVVGLLTVLLTSRIMGWDYTDKTLNYEIMAGHNRRIVYFSRVLVCIVWCFISCAVVLFLPALICTGINGWGVSADMGGMFRQYAMVFFPVFRFMSECVFLTVVLRNCYMVMIIGFVVYEFSWVFTTMMESLIEFEFTIQFVSSNIYKLLYLNHSSLEFISGEDVMVYDTCMEPELMIGTIVVSVVVGVISLLLGYWYFKKNDMD